MPRPGINGKSFDDLRTGYRVATILEKKTYKEAIEAFKKDYKKEISTFRRSENYKKIETI